MMGRKSSLPRPGAGRATESRSASSGSRGRPQASPCRRGPGPPAASTACAAREKLDEAAFRRRHAEILDEAAFRRRHAEILAHGPEGTLGKGHRTLAVDGSKITLPRELAQYGDRALDGARDPQSLCGNY